MFVATGGVNEQNVKEYLDMGFVGAGIGGRLTERKLIEAGDFAEFTRRAGFCQYSRTERKLN